MESFKRSTSTLDPGSVASSTSTFELVPMTSSSTFELDVSADEEGIQGVIVRLRGLVLGGLAQAASLGAGNRPKPSGPADAVAKASKHTTIRAVAEDGEWSAANASAAPCTNYVAEPCRTFRHSPSRSSSAMLSLVEEVHSSVLRFRIAWAGASFLLVVVVLHLAKLCYHKNEATSTRLAGPSYGELPLTAEPEIESQDPPPHPEPTEDGPAG